MPPNIIGSRNGQTLLLATLAIGGTLLGATTIAGLFMTYQIRQSVDLESSAQAIFAADAGIEWQLYNFFNASAAFPDPNPFGNRAEFVVECYDSEIPPNLISCSGLTTTSSIKSIGRAGNVSRAFLIYLQTATSTGP